MLINYDKKNKVNTWNVFFFFFLMILLANMLLSQDRTQWLGPMKGVMTFGCLEGRVDWPNKLLLPVQEELSSIVKGEIQHYYRLITQETRSIVKGEIQHYYRQETRSIVRGKWDTALLQINYTRNTEINIATKNI
jgi:hypothetical protein